VKTLIICKKCNQPKQPSEMDKGREGRPNLSTCAKCRYKKQADWKRNHPKVRLVNFAKHRAKEKGLDCTITHNDFEIPEFCPATGIKLEIGVGKLHDASPTLDRFIPALGYVPGNVVVISYKANRIKNNGTAKDLENVAKWMKQVQENTEGRLSAKRTEPVEANTLDSAFEKDALKIESDLTGDCKRTSVVTLAATAHRLDVVNYWP
jgi:hypothetical protein